MLAILAPSKTQEAQEYPKFIQPSLPQFLAEAGELNGVLAGLEQDALASLMKTSEKLTQETRQKIEAFDATGSTGHPAIFLFCGDAYDHIEPQVWTEAMHHYATDHLAILSGLYGYLRPTDLMQSYRLEMGLKLETDKGKNMYQYWGSKITQAINQQQESDREKCLINLASTEYSKVIHRKELVGNIIDIVFLQTKEGKTKTIPIHSKRARGAMANWIVKNKLKKSKDLKDFDLLGYRFDDKDSNEHTWVFHTVLD